MATTTAAMNDTNEETPEQRRARVLKARQDGIAKARAIKAEQLKVSAETGEVPVTKKLQRSEWMEIFLTFLRNREAKGVNDIPAVIKLTDETIEILKDAGKL